MSQSTEEIHKTIMDNLNEALSQFALHLPPALNDQYNNLLKLIQRYNVTEQDAIALAAKLMSELRGIDHNFLTASQNIIQIVEASMTSPHMAHALSSMILLPYLKKQYNAQYPKFIEQVRLDFREEYLKHEKDYKFNTGDSTLNVLYLLHLRSQKDSVSVPKVDLKADLEGILATLDPFDLRKAPNRITLDNLLDAQKIREYVSEDHEDSDWENLPSTVPATNRILRDISDVLGAEITKHLPDAGYMSGREVRMFLAEIEALIKQKLSVYTEPQVMGVDNFMKNWIQKLWDEHIIPQLQPNANHVVKISPN